MINLKKIKQTIRRKKELFTMIFILTLLTGQMGISLYKAIAGNTIRMGKEARKRNLTGNKAESLTIDIKSE